MTAVGQAIDLDLNLQLYYQLVHPLTTTVIAPMLVLIILNYFILARVAAGRLRRVSSRVTRYLFYSSGSEEVGRLNLFHSFLDFYVNSYLKARSTDRHCIALLLILINTLDFILISKSCITRRMERSQARLSVMVAAKICYT